MRTLRKCAVSIEDVPDVCDICSHIAKSYGVAVDIAQNEKRVSGRSLQSMFSLDFDAPIWIIVRGAITEQDYKLFDKWGINDA